MIDAKSLLSDLIRQLSTLESDLRVRIQEVPELHAALQAEWQSARDANRCAETLESWSEQLITQAGVHWLLSCVFLRFIEDNELVERPWLSGPQHAGRLALARDRAEAWFRARPLDTDREYLLAACLVPFELVCCAFGELKPLALMVLLVAMLVNALLFHSLAMAEVLMVKKGTRFRRAAIIRPSSPAGPKARRSSTTSSPATTARSAPNTVSAASRPTRPAATSRRWRSAPCRPSAPPSTPTGS